MSNSFNKGFKLQSSYLYSYYRKKNLNLILFNIYVIFQYEWKLLGYNAFELLLFYSNYNHKRNMVV